MPNKIGRMLESAINKMEEKSDKFGAAVVAAHVGSDEPEGRLPVVIKLPTRPPEPNEAWAAYRERVNQALAPVQEILAETMGVDATPLITANALAGSIRPDQAAFLGEIEAIDRIELDPRLDVTQMDDAVEDINLEGFRDRHPSLTGSGVAVAVLDSGIDQHHPYLNVDDSVSTSGESVDIPGSHGTHCAGSIASRDSFFPGVAPEVRLINVKVLRADGSGTHTGIVRGIDEAIDRGAHVLSMSLGFNHLPSWSSGGHGWMCDNGHCPLCTAVDNATSLDNTLVVVAAGNEHSRAEALRGQGFGGSFDTELGCPGQARQALRSVRLPRGPSCRRSLPATARRHMAPTSRISRRRE